METQRRLHIDKRRKLEKERDEFAAQRQSGDFDRYKMAEDRFRVADELAEAIVADERLEARQRKLPEDKDNDWIIDMALKYGIRLDGV